MCNSFFAKCALLNIFAGAFTGADIRAALSSVDSTDSLQAAVYIHLGILQVCIGAVIGFTGRIGNRLELARTPDKVIGVPFIAVINVDIFSTGDRQVSPLGNAHLNTSQQCCILVNSDLSGLNVDRNVVGDGQYITRGVDTHTRQLQRKGVQFCFAVHSQNQTIRLFIVILGKATRFHFEHTGVANEINGGGICGAHCINAAVNYLVGAGIQRQGNFDVLYEVLRKWEHPMAHAGRCAAAAEVCNLIEFVHRSARFRQNRAAAGDKAPCIEFTTVLDCNGAVIRHFDVSIITNGTSLLAAASGKIPAAQADGAIDGNGRAFAHRQRPERLRRGSRPNRRRSIRIQCPCRVKRNQKCNSSRNSIGTADRTIGRQGNLGLAVCLCIGNRFVQVCKPLTASLKKRNGFACKFCRNGAVAFNIQRSACGSCYALAGGQIVPAKELISLCRGCHHLIGSHGTLRVAVFLCNSLAIYCIGTIFGRHKGRGRSYI